MNITHKTVLITGANRGLGRALVEVALERGAKRVYAAMRSPQAHSDRRVTTLALDVTDVAQIQRTADQLDGLDVLINNAGICLFDDLSDPEAFVKHMAVNFLGPYWMTKAFQAQLRHSKGALVNVLSMAALAPVPATPAYSISKAAAHSMTQTWRAYLTGQGVTVHVVLPGLIDTDMSRGFDMPKASPESTAQAIYTGLERGEEDIFPDSTSQTIAEGWRSGVVKALEHQLAGFLPSSIG